MDMGRGREPQVGDWIIGQRIRAALEDDELGGSLVQVPLDLGPDVQEIGIGGSRP